MLGVREESTEVKPNRVMKEANVGKKHLIWISLEDGSVKMQRNWGTKMINSNIDYTMGVTLTDGAEVVPGDVVEDPNNPPDDIAIFIGTHANCAVLWHKTCGRHCSHWRKP